MLIERDESLARLDALLADVRDRGDGRLLFVGGEAGVGKTALLRAFCDAQLARDAGASVRVLWGACEPLAHAAAARPVGGRRRGRRR